jgi:hypothetical protein
LLDDFRELGLVVGDLLAPAAFSPEVAQVTLVVLLRAQTVAADDLALELLPVEALSVLLAPHVAHLLAQEALLVAVTAIVRRPQLVVGVGISWAIGTPALGLVEALEIDSHYNALARGGLGAVALFVFLTIDHELLRDRKWLNDDVSDINRVVADLEIVPSLALVEGVQDLLGGTVVLGHHYQTSMVPQFVDVGTLYDFSPGKPSITREIGRHSV